MRIHLLGIGGTGMGSLAGLLVEAGHTVTGTDEKLYPPMSDEIAKLKITPFEGYSAANIEKVKPELVVIGNVIRRENPEAQEVLNIGIPYKSMPETLSELFLKDRTPLVISGTHGKTTSSTMTAWILESAEDKPGFLIGGVGKNLERSYELGSGKFFVVEGDEYDTAFFDKGPKFLHYRPHGLIITSIEFDHADIYRDLDHIKESFRKLVGIMPAKGMIVANADDENVKDILEKSPCKVIVYGVKSGTYRPINVSASEGGTSFELLPTRKKYLLPMWGEHNLSNAVGVITLLIESGISEEKIAQGIQTFKGVKRRQEIVSETNTVTIIDDFAHHPTAVAKTIESMRFRFPKRRIWVVFEPRSNTSRRNIFQNEFADALGMADRVIIASPFREETLKASERLDPAKIAATIMKTGIDAHHISDPEHIIEYIMRNVTAHDVILVMSNGGFGGLISKLGDALQKRKIFTDESQIAHSRVPPGAGPNK